MDSQVTNWAMLYRALRTAFDQYVDGSREGECSYKHRCTVESISEHGDQVDVNYACQGEGHVMNADLVIGADGASSRIRQYFLPNVKRTYSGYVILRGLVPQSELSSSSYAAFAERVNWYWGSDFMALAYVIPGEDDAVDEKKRLVNWGWYINCTEEELADIMTDCNGVTRTHALPMGSMRPEVAARLKSAAVGAMPPQLVELIEKTALPFVQVITDMISPENVFLGGKVVLVGDAMACAR
jgi:2-polyprenyl-6-methoxyphenol hydroxylase-like FAD-dependent oxidoreductase